MKLCDEIQKNTKKSASATGGRATWKYQDGHTYACMNSCIHTYVWPYKHIFIDRVPYGLRVNAVERTSSYLTPLSKLALRSDHHHRSQNPRPTDGRTRILLHPSRLPRAVRRRMTREWGGGSVVERYGRLAANICIYMQTARSRRRRRRIARTQADPMPRFCFSRGHQRARPRARARGFLQS